MNENRSGAYFVSRRGGGRKRRGSRRGAGILITVLMLLSAAIVGLVILLPRLNAGSSSPVGFSGKVFYFLATAEETEKETAGLAAREACDRGGAGYIYNNGNYTVIAAVYSRESDAKTVTSVNAGSFYFALTVPAASMSDADRKLAEFLTGEWFETVYTASAELERGNITEASAERAVNSVNAVLLDLCDGASKKPARLITDALSLPPLSTDVLRAIRYTHVAVTVAAATAFA